MLSQVIYPRVYHLLRYKPRPKTKKFCPVCCRQFKGHGNRRYCGAKCRNQKWYSKEYMRKYKAFRRAKDSRYDEEYTRRTRTETKERNGKRYWGNVNYWRAYNRLAHRKYRARKLRLRMARAIHQILTKGAQYENRRKEK